MDISFGLGTTIKKVYPYRAAQVRGIFLDHESDSWSPVAEALIRHNPSFEADIRHKNHIVVELDNGIGIWLSDRHAWFGTAIVEEPW